ncbi:chemotaxis protein CheW [Paenibacillus agricola]|uniref:chemotaxis protein CheW n=1 Tax=Paenibacillus agricola TaxID=2716264 RepID=UPI002892FC79|nr:chemotaxis protein CheW [Paenibacillus agricola]
MEAKQDQYIEVGIGKEKYALRIDNIHEIIKMLDITEIPNSKSYVKGVINLRGKIVPIISLRNRFGLVEESNTKSTRIVVSITPMKW